MNAPRIASPVRSGLAALALFAVPATQAGAAAVDICYRVHDADSGAPLRPTVFVRLAVQPVGKTGTGRTIHEVHGTFTQQRDNAPEAEAEVEMSLLTGSALIASGEGAQMSLLRNFGRGESGFSGFSVLDCGAKQAKPGAPRWICRGTTVSPDLEAAVRARPLRLERVPRQTPECAAMAFRPD